MNSSLRNKLVKVEVEDSYEENSFRKLLKYEGNNKSSYNAIIYKLTSLCKDFWISIDYEEEEFTENDIKLSFDTEKNIYKGSVRCFICSTYIAIAYRADSISFPGYKKHVQNHLTNPQVFKPRKIRKSSIKPKPPQTDDGKYLIINFTLNF